MEGTHCRAQVPPGETQAPRMQFRHSHIGRPEPQILTALGIIRMFSAPLLNYALEFAFRNKNPLANADGVEFFCLYEPTGCERRDRQTL